MYDRVATSAIYPFPQMIKFIYYNQMYASAY